MNQYSKNYLKIYLWRLLSILSGFLSLFIVVPHLSNNVELYGIYSFCIAFTLYLSYADIGFLSAGQKYAAEAYARNDREEEMRILGFTGAVLLMMVVPFSVVMIYLSFYPDIIINGLSDDGASIASSIFLIMGVVTPLQIFLQRLVQSILIIRIKDYISLRIDVIANLIKIVSVFYFFSSSNYHIVPYYFFISFVTLVSSMIILFIIKKEESYDFLYLVKNVKLRRTEFDKVKKLAFSSLFLTIAWVIYYEFDLIIIGKLFGPKEVAIYAVAFTFLNFLRTLWNMVFSPFAQRFNHFVGLNSRKELEALVEKIITYTFPLCIIVTMVLMLFSRELTIFWVGGSFEDSVSILGILILGTGFSFITKPAGYYFVADTKYNYMYSLAIILPIVFLSTLWLLMDSYGVLGVAIAKSFAMFCGFIISFFGIFKCTNPWRGIQKSLFSVTLSGVALYYLAPLISKEVFDHYSKDSWLLLKLLCIMLILILFMCGGVLISGKMFREELMSLLKKNKLKINVNQWRK